MSTRCAGFTTLCRALGFARRRRGLGTVVLAAGVLFGGGGADAKGAWTAPVRLDAGGSSPAVAVDGRGDAVAVWPECSPGCAERSLISDYLAAGTTTWAGPVPITTGGYFGTVGTDGAGNAMTLWSGPAGIGSAVRAASSGTWQSTSVSSASPSGFDEMRLAVDPAGDAVAVWEREFLVEAAVGSAKTGAWLAPVVISGATEHASEPAVAIGAHGDIEAAWKVYEPETTPCQPPHSVPCVVILHSKDSIKAASRQAGGSWQQPVTLQTGDSAIQPRIALDSDGNATSIWSIASGADIVESDFKAAGGGWLAPVPLVSSAFVARSGLYGGLQLALDGNGEATAAWSGVDASERDPQGVWQRPTVLSGTQANAAGVKLAVNARGAAVAVWTCQRDPSHYPLYVGGAIRPGAGASWEQPSYVSASDGWLPAVAMGPEGRAIAVWEQQGPFAAGDPAPGIYSSLYQPGVDGPPGVTQLEACAKLPAPKLSRVRMTHARFRTAQRRTRRRSRFARGTTFIFTLSTEAEVTIDISRMAPGREHGDKCLQPNRALQRTRARRCTRLIHAGTVLRSGEPTGTDRVTFSGRIGRRALAPGTYVARVLARNAHGSSPPITLRFYVAP